ncbi:MAG: hypothetical protein NDF54_11170, partial [archaeon GB-1867-035]|nr:hypothetical protein [Candidatus Culexmicrobium profundum]
MRVLKVEDYNRIISVVDPQLSPSSDKIAFVTTKVDSSKDNYIMNIWVIKSDSGEVVLFTKGDKDCWPRWSPNGRQLLFISKRILGEEEEGRELWVLNVGGGEPRLICKRSEGIELAQWSPDGKKILFISRVIDEEFEKDV